jgi:dihydrofolate synthase / folylpolyglutamate synthase
MSEPLIQRLYDLTLQKNRKRGLSEVLKLREACGYPDQKFAAIHVGGTNGKGSVSLKIAQGLSLSGHKVGLYTSPHLSSFRERISIQGELISEKDFSRLLGDIFKAADQQALGLTFFEVTTVLAFLYFAEQKVDFAVIEVGLGGRLDTTNFIHPILSVITSIGSDHTHILGDTLDEIAFEKAGIIKEGVPVVIGPKAKFSPILKEAIEKKSLLIKVPASAHLFYDQENSKTAKAALRHLQKTVLVQDEAIKKALQCRPSCRFEIVPFERASQRYNKIPEKIVLDVAHNPPAFEKLLSALMHHFPSQKIRFFLAFSEDKDKKSCLEKIIPFSSFIHLVRTTHARLSDPFKVKEMLAALGYFSASASLDIKEEFLKALDEASLHGEVLVVAGSFFIMREVREMLGYLDPTDEVELQEKYTFSESKAE